MLEMVERAQTQYDVEGPDARRVELIHVHPQVPGLRLKCAVQLAERILIDVIDRRHIRPAALCLKCVKPVPRTDIEQRLAAQVLRQSERGPSLALPIQGHHTGQHPAAGQLDAVIETGGVQHLLHPVLAALGFQVHSSRLTTVCCHASCAAWYRLWSRACVARGSPAAASRAVRSRHRHTRAPPPRTGWRTARGTLPPSAHAQRTRPPPRPTPGGKRYSPRLPDPSPRSRPSAMQG